MKYGLVFENSIQGCLDPLYQNTAYIIMVHLLCHVMDLWRATVTVKGSEVFYSCDPGLVPEGRMKAVCTRNGWSPNPAELCCTFGEYK